MIQILSAPWPWYVAGPLIGLFVPGLLLAGSALAGTWTYAALESRLPH